MTILARYGIASVNTFTGLGASFTSFRGFAVRDSVLVDGKFVNYPVGEFKNCTLPQIRIGDGALVIADSCAIIADSTAVNVMWQGYCAISNSTIRSELGDAVYVRRGASLGHCTLQAPRGKGIQVVGFGGVSADACVITDCEVGAKVYFGSLNLSNSLIANCIYGAQAEGYGSLTAAHCVFSHNGDMFGAQILVGDSGFVTIVNSVVAWSYGPGIVAWNDYGSLTAYNNCFWKDAGGDIEVGNLRFVGDRNWHNDPGYVAGKPADPADPSEYRLSGGSFCRNRGMVIDGFPHDARGREWGSEPDLGFLSY